MSVSDLESPSSETSTPSRRTSPRRGAKGTVVAAALGWAGFVIVAFAGQRDFDVAPVLTAFGGHVASLLAAVGILALYCPVSWWFVVARGGATGSALTDLLRVVGGAVVAVVATSVALVALGRVEPWAFWGVAGLAAVARPSAWRSLGELSRRAHTEWRAEPATVPRVATGLLLATAFFVAILPEVAQDSLAYHLAVPQHWIEHRGFAPLPGSVYSWFPMHTEMLYLTGLVVGDEASAKLFHWLLLVASCLAVRQLARRLGAGRESDWAMLALVSLPTVFRVGTWAYVELAIVFFLVLAWLALGAGRLERARFLEASVWLGFLCGTKYTALPWAALAVVYVAARASRARVRSALTIAIGSALVGGFWYVRNAIETGNPFFPFGYAWFGGEGWDAARAEMLTASLADWGRLGWNLPWDVTMASRFASVADFDGAIGPLFLAFIPVVAYAAWRRPTLRPTATVAVVLALAWVTSTRQIRFLVPCLAILAALIPAATRTLGRAALPWTRATQFASALVATGIIAVVVAREAPVAHAIGAESFEQARARRLPGGDATLFARIPEVVPADGRILFGACGHPVYLCRRPHHADAVVENHTLRDILKIGGSVAGVRAEFERRGFTHLLFRFELVFDETGRRTDLSLREQRLLQSFLAAHAKPAAREASTFLFAIEEPRSSNPEARPSDDARGTGEEEE